MTGLSLVMQPAYNPNVHAKSNRGQKSLFYWKEKQCPDSRGDLSDVTENDTPFDE
jgi:hypothetical protein